MNWEALWAALRIVYIVTGILGAIEVIAFVVVVIVCLRDICADLDSYGSPF